MPPRRKWDFVGEPVINRPVITDFKELEEHDAEVRAKAIDEFAERMKQVGIEKAFYCDDTSEELCDGKCGKCEERFKKAIDKIAEQLKAGVEDGK